MLLNPYISFPPATVTSGGGGGGGGGSAYDGMAAADWQLFAGQIVIDGSPNQAHYNGTSFGAAAVLKTSAGSDDHQATIYMLNSVDTTAEVITTAVDLRRDSVTALDPHSNGTYYYFLFERHSTTYDNIYLYKVIAGSQTFINNWSISIGGCGGNGTTEILSAKCVGSTLTAYINSTLVATQTDSSITTGTYSGIRIAQQTTGDAMRGTRFILGT
jgi:hypothetical protein